MCRSQLRADSRSVSFILTVTFPTSPLYPLFTPLFEDLSSSLYPFSLLSLLFLISFSLSQHGRPICERPIDRDN